MSVKRRSEMPSRYVSEALCDAANCLSNDAASASHARAALRRDLGGGAVRAEELVLAEGEGAEDAGGEASAVRRRGGGLRRERGSDEKGGSD